MFDRIKALIHRWNEVREVSAFTDRDLQDLGLSRAQLESFVQMPRDVPDRVLAMAAIFGLSEEDVKANHGEWLDLLETCAGCHERSACAVVLSRGDLSRPCDCGFCLSADGFSAKSRAVALGHRGPSTRRQAGIAFP